MHADKENPEWTNADFDRAVRVDGKTLTEAAQAAREFHAPVEDRMNRDVYRGSLPVRQ